MRRNVVQLLLLCLTMILSGQNFAAPSGEIRGRVVDAENGQALPGANVYLKDTNIGAATDIRGEYVIHDVPPGSYTLVVNYIGYGASEVDVRVSPNETVSADVQMDYTVLTGEDVVVTAQARAQTETINQQISARTVKNIVSATKIQELPEANAAEAVGRLPGVSLERSGGEGTKVLIRGMGAKYTKVQVDGVDMTATSSEDRSTDSSMISPYMLEGIELTKSVMADQEATATGGIVNFKIKKAPDEPSFNVVAQGGMNDLRDTYQNYKLSLGGSHRFYENMLGLYAQVDYEEKDAGSQQLGGVTFFQENEQAPVRTNSMQLMDIFRHFQRLGGVMVLDYMLPSTEIKLSNFASRIQRQETRYVNNYGFFDQNFGINYADTPGSHLTVLINSLTVDHQWKNWEFKTAFSHSYSENILPDRITSENSNSPQSPFPADRKANYNVNLDPETIPYLLTVSMDEAVNFMDLGGIAHEESETRERDLTGAVNLAYSLNLSDQVNMKISFGGKYRHKTKQYDRTDWEEGTSQIFRNMIIDDFKDELCQRTLNAWDADNMRILLIDFFDEDYKGGDFLDGKYNFGNIFDKQKFRRIHELVKAEWDPPETDFYDIPQPNFITSNYQDYHGHEDYYAFYLMPKINVTSKFTFVPGVRYEANRTEYTGYRGNRLGILRDFRPTPIDTVAKIRENEFVLPMVQAVYRPTEWLNFKAGYTHTLQRPNYNNIMPGWVINTQGSIDNLSNFRLEPELSRNWDVQMSVYSDKIGLFTLGAFHKRIKDMIFWTGQTVITDTLFFELPSLMHRQRAAYAVNNPHDAFNYGYEIEWQSNFWYLPGLLNGLVMNVNYTRNESEAKYLRSEVKTVINPVTYQSRLISEDTTYTNPMLGQPDHLLNLTLGYDYKGFSIRGAMRYKSRIFTSNSWYEKLRGYSTDFYRYDLMLRQQLPVDGLEFFLNVNNLTGERERSVINHMNYTSYLEDYGRSANLGFRYRL